MSALVLDVDKRRSRVQTLHGYEDVQGITGIVQFDGSHQVPGGHEKRSKYIDVVGSRRYIVIADTDDNLLPDGETGTTVGDRVA